MRSVPILRSLRAVAVALALALALGACGDDDDEGAITIRGADDIQIVDAEQATAANAEAEAQAEAAESGTTAPEAEGDGGDTAFDDVTSDTVAVDDDRSPDERMFDAFTEFRSCLEARGTAFVGAPDESGEGPQNDPAYIESLTVCAAQSNIVEALEESRSAVDDMTPEQVEERNEGVLDFVDCMEGRGWTVEVTAGTNGVLQPSSMEGPNGESPLDGTSTDLEQCAAEGQEAAEAREAGEA